MPIQDTVKPVTFRSKMSDIQTRVRNVIVSTNNQLQDIAAELTVDAISSSGKEANTRLYIEPIQAKEIEMFQREIRLLIRRISLDNTLFAYDPNSEIGQAMQELALIETSTLGITDYLTHCEEKISEWTRQIKAKKSTARKKAVTTICAQLSVLISNTKNGAGELDGFIATMTSKEFIDKAGKDTLVLSQAMVLTGKLHTCVSSLHTLITLAENTWNALIENRIPTTR